MLTLSLSSQIAVLVAATLIFVALRARGTQQRGTLPPGPKPLPLLGNLLDMPHSEEWLTWRSYVERYGDLVYLSALGRGYLLLGSQEAITDIIEKRSHVNDRPKLTMLHELMDITWLLASMPYGEYWRQNRKLIHAHAHAGAAVKYQPMQIRGARRLVCDLLASEKLRNADLLSDSAKAVLPHKISNNLGHTGVHMIYGIDIRDSAMEAKFVKNPATVFHAFSEALTPGRFMVDFLPLLKYLPAWVPGASFQRYAQETAMLGKQIRDDPIAVVQRQMASGTAPVSMAAHLLKSVTNQNQLVKDATASMFLGAGDTTTAVITSFFLAMVVHPEVQKRAQEELDHVVGRDRLPEYSDKDNLPYLDGVIRESLRWLPVAPSGVPHVTTQDDEYRGYLIPKGTMTIPLQWQILHDPTTYPDPSTFSPERYLVCLPRGEWSIRDDVPDPRKVAFGFGRRVCPGPHIAEQSLFATFATVLHTMHIFRAKDSDGKEVLPDVGMSSGVVCHARPFAYGLRMRNDAQRFIDSCIAMVEQ